MAVKGCTKSNSD